MIIKPLDANSRSPCGARAVLFHLGTDKSLVSNHEFRKDLFILQADRVVGNISWVIARFSIRHSHKISRIFRLSLWRTQSAEYKFAIDMFGTTKGERSAAATRLPCEAFCINICSTHEKSVWSSHDDGERSDEKLQRHNVWVIKHKSDEFISLFVSYSGLESGARKDVAVCFLKHLLNVIQTPRRARASSRPPEEALAENRSMAFRKYLTRETGNIIPTSSGDSSVSRLFSALV